MVFSYTTCLEPSNAEFKKACMQIESYIAYTQKEKLLIDVDGSLIQIYYVGDKSIKIYNDYWVSAVYVDSEIDLSGVIKGIVEFTS